MENGINVAGVHVNFAYHRRKEDPHIRVYISQLPIGIELGEIYEVFKYYDIVKEINKIERVIQGRKVDTGNRVIIFARIATNIPSYVYVRGWHGFVNYRGQQKTCRLCSAIDNLAKDCPKARKQQDLNQSGPQPQGEPQGQPGSPPLSQNDTRSGASHVTHEVLMDTQTTNASVRNEMNLIEKF